MIVTVVSLFISPPSAAEGSVDVVGQENRFCLSSVDSIGSFGMRGKKSLQQDDVMAAVMAAVIAAVSMVGSARSPV